jgi:hypothetical protein
VKLIQTTTLISGGLFVEFVSIPQSFTDLVLVGSVRGDNSAVGSTVFIRFNSDVTSGVVTRRLTGTGGAVSSVTNSDGGNAFFGDVSGATSTTNTFGTFGVYIPNYTSSSAKTFSADTVSENNATAAFQALGAGSYAGTSSVNTILFALLSGNFVAGSTISLYGITKGSDGIVTAS